MKKRNETKQKNERKKRMKIKIKNGKKKKKGEKIQYYRFAEPVIIAGPRNAHRRPLILFCSLTHTFPHPRPRALLIPFLSPSLLFIFSFLSHSSTSQTGDPRRLRLYYYGNISENENFNENVTGAPMDGSGII